jgi:DNA-binding PadR family transcriptional regulator
MHTRHSRSGRRSDRHSHRHPPFPPVPPGPPDFEGPPGRPGVPFGDFGPRGDFGPGPRGRGRHRGRGARRGDVRAAVLALLTERPMHGYEIIQQIEERSGGVWRPSPGSIYPSLQLLADEGLVTGDEVGGRRLFTLTDAGREAAARRQGDSPWHQERDETFEVAHRFRDELGQLAMAVWQVAQAGTEAQRTEILGVLADARRRAYQLLADGSPAPEPPADTTPAE